MWFRENENAWLLTLPEIRTEGHLIPACKIVAVRTVGGDRYEDGLSCTLFLSCQYEGNTLDQTFAAVLRTYIRPDGSEYSFLDLADGDFIIDSSLRGRGLGSWIMQQFVCWARTLPADMRVRRIKLSVRDDADEENYLRRENFGAGWVSGLQRTVMSPFLCVSVISGSPEAGALRWLPFVWTWPSAS